MSTRAEGQGEGRVIRRIGAAGLALGPLLGLVVYLMLPDRSATADGLAVALGHAGRVTAAVGVWMAVWWITEAIPVYATALVPLAILPATGATSMKAAAAPYGHELIFLFMGGFILALSMERWGLHRRVALAALSVVGSRPPQMVAGFMFVTAALSMWVSNTATSIMMLPVALSTIDLARRDGNEEVFGPDEQRNFALALLLGIAYSASIGGIGTLIGTPPNLFLATFAENQLGVEISFVRWMAIGMPLTAVFLPIVWWLLTRVLHPLPNRELRGGARVARRRLAELGPLSRGEIATAVVFGITSSCWIFRPLLREIEVAGRHPLGGLSDPGIAMLAALSLFLIPVDWRRGSFAMNWETAVKLPWGLLLLFGGGLSLAVAVKDNGVAEFLGAQFAGLAGIPTPLLVLLVVSFMIFLTELTSNTATAATLIPIFAALATALELSPFLLIVPAAIGASCAFMLPVATPPNAVVFGSGEVEIRHMVRAGLWLNLVGIVLITLLVYSVVIPVLGLVVAVE